MKKKQNKQDTFSYYQGNYSKKKVTKKFRKLVDKIMDEYDEAFKKLAEM